MWRKWVFESSCVFAQKNCCLNEAVWLSASTIENSVRNAIIQRLDDRIVVSN